MHAGGEAASWGGPPARSGDGTLAVDAFNDYVDDSDGAWTRSPAAIAATFLALETDPRATTVRVEFSGEARDSALVTVRVDALADDSIRGYRYVLSLTPAREKWRIRAARWTQRCWPGRGHQSFTTELCL